MQLSSLLALSKSKGILSKNGERRFFQTLMFRLVDEDNWEIRFNCFLLLAVKWCHKYLKYCCIHAVGIACTNLQFFAQDHWPPRQETPNKFYIKINFNRSYTTAQYIISISNIRFKYWLIHPGGRFVTYKMKYIQTSLTKNIWYVI